MTEKKAEAEGINSSPFDTLAEMQAIQDAQGILYTAMSAAIRSAGSAFNNPPWDLLHHARKANEHRLRLLMKEGS